MEKGEEGECVRGAAAMGGGFTEGSSTGEVLPPSGRNAFPDECRPVAALLPLSIL